MKTTKIVIKNLFGIKETELDGRSVEISGPKGSGKTSVLDSIRYALTNRSDRDYIVHRGADEGEILIETDTGLSIDRKALPAKSAGTVKVRDGSLLQTRPAEFLSQIFTPLQLNPVEFTQLSRQEKNRVILNLIEFAWDTNWIREQFGEIRRAWITPSISSRSCTTFRRKTASISSHARTSTAISATNRHLFPTSRRTSPPATILTIGIHIPSVRSTVSWRA